jgi:choice-of-anchor C domain-containing protein
MKVALTCLIGLLFLTALSSPAQVIQKATRPVPPAQKKPSAADLPEKNGNLLVNGSFEEGSTDGPPGPGIGFVWLNEGQTDIKGWKVTRGQLSYVWSHWEAFDGQRSLDMHGGPGFGGIAQTFRTKKGQRYLVTFALAGNPLGPVPMKKLGVKAAGQEAEFLFDTAGKTPTDMGWQIEAWEFTATGAETTLELYTRMTEDENCGPAIDDVSVIEIKA